MQQKVLLVCKIYLFCIYYSLSNFNYPKLEIPSKLTKFFRESFAELRKKNKTCLGFEVCIWYPIWNYWQVKKGCVGGSRSGVVESTKLVPAQWIQCDLRNFKFEVLGKFSVIMADPPWDIHMELPYGTMSDDEMRELPVPGLQVTLKGWVDWFWK